MPKRNAEVKLTKEELKRLTFSTEDPTQSICPDCDAVYLKENLFTGEAITQCPMCNPKPKAKKVKKEKEPEVQQKKPKTPAKKASKPVVIEAEVIKPKITKKKGKFFEVNEKFDFQNFVDHYGPGGIVDVGLQDYFGTEITFESFAKACEAVQKDTGRWEEFASDERVMVMDYFTEKLGVMEETPLKTKPKASIAVPSPSVLKASAFKNGPLSKEICSKSPK